MRSGRGTDVRALTCGERALRLLGASARNDAHLAVLVALQDLSDGKGDDLPDYASTLLPRAARPRPAHV